MSMEIQRLGIEEPERVRTIRLAALLDAPYAFGSTWQDAVARPLESWRQELEALATFVAVLDGIDVGMVRSAHSDEPGVGELLSMWVSPAARGRGVGEALVDAVVDWARAEGLHRLLLDVTDDNAPAIALYGRMGFVPTGSTNQMPPPREHIRRHQRARSL